MAVEGLSSGMKELAGSFTKMDEIGGGESRVEDDLREELSG